MRRVGWVPKCVAGIALLSMGACGAGGEADPVASEAVAGSSMTTTPSPIAPTAGTTTTPDRSADPAGATRPAFPYSVKAGDSLSAIAQTSCTTIDEVVRANDWSSSDHVLLPGDVILVPYGTCATDATTPEGATADGCGCSSEPGEFSWWNFGGWYTATFETPECVALANEKHRVDLGDGMNTPLFTDAGPFLAALESLPGDVPADVSDAANHAIGVQLAVGSKIAALFEQYELGMWDAPEMDAVIAELRSAGADQTTLVLYLDDVCPATFVWNPDVELPVVALAGSGSVVTADSEAASSTTTSPLVSSPAETSSTSAAQPGESSPTPPDTTPMPASTVEEPGEGGASSTVQR